MRKFSQINEGVDYHPYTWDELFYMIDHDEVEFVNCDKEGVRENIKGYIDQLSDSDNSGKSWYNPDINTSPIVKKKSIICPLHFGGSDCVLVFDEGGKPTAFVGEYELSNAFVFGEIVICPGHDSITCYNIKTREHKTSHIR